MRNRLVQVSVAITVAALPAAVAGCGGGDDSGSGAPFAAATPSVAPSADDVTPTETPTVEPDGAGPAPSPTEPTPTAPTPTEAPEGTAAPASPAAEEFLSSLEGVIVFSSERDDGPETSSDDLYQMNADGSDVRRLTDTDRNEWWPQVSAEGSVLLFGRNYPGESRAPRSGHAAWGVWIWESGSDPVDITDNRQFQSGARLSPDGTQILLTSGQGSRAGFEDGLYELGDTNVWVMDRDGSNARQLTEGGASAGSWSPDGTEILFTAVPDGAEADDVFVMAADGSDVRQLTDTPADESRPDWSPDGSRIVFDSDADGDTEIHVMAADGSEVVQLTDNDVTDDFARWSPDGDAIAFTSDHDGNSEIYVMAADGSFQTNVSNDPALDVFPAWSPVPFG